MSTTTELKQAIRDLLDCITETRGKDATAAVQRAQALLEGRTAAHGEPSKSSEYAKEFVTVPKHPDHNARFAVYQAFKQLQADNTPDWPDAIGDKLIEEFLSSATPTQECGASRIAKLERMAATGTVDAFMTLPEHDKRLGYALLVEESSRRKKAEQELADLREQMACSAEQVSDFDQHWSCCGFVPKGANPDHIYEAMKSGWNGHAALQHTAPAPSKAGEWTDEQKDILRRAAEILEHDCGRPHNAKELLALLSSAPAQAGSADSERAFYKAWDAYTQAPTYDMHRKDDFAAFEYAWKAALSAQGQQSEDARDAARYRWLTEHAYIKRCLTERGEIFLVGNVERKVPVDDSYPSVSAAIDAAMSTTPSEKDGGKE